MVYEKPIQIKITVPANTPANSILQAKMIDDPSVGEVGELQVPTTQIWIIEDIYVKENPAIDLYLEIYKNGTKKMATLGPVSTMNIQYNTRPMVPRLGYGPGDILSIKAINLDSGGTADTTVTVYAKVKVLEAGVDF